MESSRTQTLITALSVDTVMTAAATIHGRTLVHVCTTSEQPYSNWLSNPTLSITTFRRVNLWSDPKKLQQKVFDEMQYYLT